MIHFTRPSYAGKGACQSNPNQNLTVTEDISKVTCMRCLSAITPVHAKLEALRKAALEHN